MVPTHGMPLTCWTTGCSATATRLLFKLPVRHAAAICEQSCGAVRTETRRNQLGIQMIAAEIREKIFGQINDQQSGCLDPEKLQEVKSHLSKHGLCSTNNICQDEIRIQLPQLEGSDVLQHFHRLATRFSAPFKSLCDSFCAQSSVPPPIIWSDRSGWTKYLPNGTNVPVSYPESQFLVLDVEVCVQEGDQVVLATACDGSSWFSWCSPILWQHDDCVRGKYHLLDQLIPMGKSDIPRLIVGHNVAYDRSFLREVYDLKADETRFMDTMSLHVAISGLTGYQRALSSSYRVGRSRGVNESILSEIFKQKGLPNPINWEEYGVLNNLVDVYAFYCKKNSDFQPLQKEARNVFVEGSLQDVRLDFQNLMSYCARDVKVTGDVFRQQWPKFLERFPHPVTLTGMIEMSVTYLPLKVSAWDNFIESSEQKFQQANEEIVASLTTLANQACRLLHGHKYKKDPWLWDLDWTTQGVRFRKSTELDGMKERLERLSRLQQVAAAGDRVISPVDVLLESASFLKLKQPFMAGYPSWYRDFCSKNEPKGLTGPDTISTQMRAVPKLMRLMWDGYAVHYVKGHGWGFLVPTALPPDFNDDHELFPYAEYIKVVKPIGSGQDPWDAMSDPEMISIGDEILSMAPNRTDDTEWGTDRPEYCAEVDIPGCRFYKLPHKDGPESNVGNPLSREFLRYIEDGRLTAFGDEIAGSLLKLNNSISYWKMNRKRIRDQIVVDCGSDYGVILPRVVVAGTVTRRAVEATWLTASNAYPDRVGSELKAMVRAPDGWNFVGADVDSQELWIASVLGDAAFAGVHGCTAIGWMTLEGTKAQGTDMHSKTASIVNITRNEAKVLNYGRIYGAGKRFAARFLRQSNPSLTEEEAVRKARDIYRQTKGHKSGDRWIGGTESYMFNRLEGIARGKDPATPVLGCRVSSALESEHVRDDFMTSLINWVVQSSAVDFLHLMLTCMKWLFQVYEIDGRFAISIHDEVRFLVRQEDVYKAAYALQLTNLLTRSFISAQLGMRDLPQCIAFFSSVDVDTVLRKEPDMDCVTPSNPLGLDKGYGTRVGQTLNILQIVDKVKVANQ